MVEQQMTFGEPVGLDPSVPVGPHPDDIVICEDGWICKHSETFADCQGGLHHTDGERFETDVEIVSEFLGGVDEWVCEYATGNSDYADGYLHIVDEVSYDWPDRIEEWVRNEHGDIYGHTRFDDCMDRLVEFMCDDLDGSFDCEPEYGGNEYAAYTGPGCCLWGTDIGECEEQLSISDHPILKHFHDRGTLDDILDYVRSDAYVSRSKRRVKNEETGRYESVGRETYDPYGSDYPDILTYHMPGGRWDFVVSEERMKEVLTGAIITVARNTR